jgi:hypothetical protein
MLGCRLVTLAIALASLAGCVEDEPTGESFSLVVLPDTQYYAQGHPDIFLSQTTWIREHADQLGIGGVVHVGDLVENGNQEETEWEIADEAFATLEQRGPGRLVGIPFGIAPGNHDQTPRGNPGGTESFNEWFGVHRFENRAYYGGACGHGNDNSFMTLEVGGTRLLILLVAYDEEPDAETLEWMQEVLREHPDHLAVMAAHHVIGREAEWSGQGQVFFEAIRHEPQMRLILAGHVRGEARRTDDGITTLLADYQGRAEGGSGWLRLLTFHPAEDRLQVRTYSPYLDEWERDADSDFELDFDFELDAE